MSNLKGSKGKLISIKTVDLSPFKSVNVIYVTNQSKHKKRRFAKINSSKNLVLHGIHRKDKHAFPGY